MTLAQPSISHSWSYPESAGNGWTGTCSTGTKQSPINLDRSMAGDALIHAPIDYYGYFRGGSMAKDFKVISCTNL